MIVKEPDPRLRQKAIAVKEINKEIPALVETMIEAMHLANGVGLAANQIGSPLSILVASPDGRKGKELVLINPTLLRMEGRDRSKEGCLSLPGISAEVIRSSRVTASGLDRQGKPVTVQAEGLLARILQHEVDHLQGELFIDRLRFWQRHRLLRQYRRFCASLAQVRL